MGLLDELLTRSATPVLQAAGFRRWGRKYALESPGGAAVVVQFGAGDTATHGGFHGEWGVLPPAVRDYYAHGKSGAALQTTHGILRKPIQPVQGFWLHPRGNVWLYPRNGGQEPCAAALADVLRTLVPYWNDLLRPNALDHELTSELPADLIDFNEGIPFWSPIDLWAYVAVHIDDGDLQRLASLLVELQQKRPDDDRVPWFRDRLTKRLSHAG